MALRRSSVIKKFSCIAVKEPRMVFILITLLTYMIHVVSNNCYSILATNLTHRPQDNKWLLTASGIIFGFVLVLVKPQLGMLD